MQNFKLVRESSIEVNFFFNYFTSMQKADLQSVMQFLPISEHNARVLLIEYRWNVEKVLDVLVDKGKDYLFAEAGISTSKREDSASSSSSSSSLTCCVCFDDVSSNNASMMDCCHTYCNTCKFFFIITVSYLILKCYYFLNKITSY